MHLNLKLTFLPRLAASCSTLPPHLVLTSSLPLPTPQGSWEPNSLQSVLLRV